MSQALYDLPEGWEWKRLRDVAFSARNTVEPLENHTYHNVGLENIQSNTGVLIDFVPTDGKDISSTKVAFKKDSVLFGKLRPYLNKVYLAEFDGIATTEIIPFQCTNLLTPKFLAHYMRTGFFINWAMANCSGARMPRATSKFFDELAYVPLPPLAEQTRIVEKLDAVLSRIDTAIDELQQSRVLVDAMFKSGLDKAFNPLGSPTNEAGLYDLPDGWGWTTWQQSVDVKNGKDYKAVQDDNGRYPVYGSGGVMAHASDYLCNENSVVIGRKGTINNPLFVKEKFWNIDTAFGLEAKQEQLMPLYLYYFCLSFNFIKLNTSTTLPSLTKSNLLSLSMPLPNLAEQQRVVEALDALNDKTTQLKTELIAKIGMFNQLKASVLDGAFRGEVS